MTGFRALGYLKPFRYLLIPFLAVCLWQIAFNRQFLPPTQAAPPLEVVKHIFSLMASTTFLKHIGFSLVRLATAFLLGGAVGIVSGIVLARSRWGDELFSPGLQFLAPVPVIVWLPFLIMFFGIGERARILLVAIAVYFIVHFYTFKATREVQSSYLDVALIYEKGVLERIRHIILPSAAADLFAAFRITLALGWVLLFIAEYAYSTPKRGGLGWFIADARLWGRIEDQLAGVAVLGIIAFLIDFGVSKIGSWYLRWRV